MGSTAYFRGDAFALTNYNGFPSGLASKYANVWLKVPHSSSAYANLSDGVTVPTTIAQLYISGTITGLAPTVAAGQHVGGVEVKTKSAGHAITTMLFARASGAPLPVEELMTSGSDHLSDVMKKRSAASA